MKKIMVGHGDEWEEVELTKQELAAKIASGQLWRCEICNEPGNCDDGLESYHDY